MLARILVVHKMWQLFKSSKKRLIDYDLNCRRWSQQFIVVTVQYEIDAKLEEVRLKSESEFEIN